MHAGARAWVVGGAGGEARAAAGRTPDEVARAADAEWGAGEGEAMLRRLAAGATEFRDAGVTRLEQAYRAERLVLALDRLLAAWPERARAKAAGPALDKLFAEAQSVPDFQPGRFAIRLQEFAAAAGLAGAEALSDPGF